MSIEAIIAMEQSTPIKTLLNELKYLFACHPRVVSDIISQTIKIDPIIKLIAQLVVKDKSLVVRIEVVRRGGFVKELIFLTTVPNQIVVKKNKTEWCECA